MTGPQELITLPSASQRAFVIAARAAGLPWDAVCQMLPPGPVNGAALDKAQFEAQFEEERKASPLLAIRLIIARILQRALLDDDAAAVAAQLAVFKSIKNWTQLVVPEPATVELYLHRLTQRERDQFRRLYEKAVGEIEDDATKRATER